MRPLSFAQRRLWLLDQLEPGNIAYNITFAVWLTGELDVAALGGALNEVVRRHDVLRSSIAVRDGEPVQVVAPRLSIAMEVEELRGVPVRRRRREVERAAAAQARGPFDLGTPPLLRTGLLRLAEREHVLLLTVHHVVSDAWSFGVLVREMVELYAALREGRPSPLPPLAAQYADFAEWQRQRLEGAELGRLLAYWKERLAGLDGALRLPADHARQPVRTYRGAWRELALPRRLTDAMKALARREGVTLFMVLLAALQAFLLRHTGQEDVAVGVPIANRRRAEEEALIGFFLNTLVMRTDLGGDPTFRELLGRVRDVALGAYEHQDLPFERLVEELRPRRDPGHGPLFDVMLNLQTAPIPAIELPGLGVRVEPVDNGTAKFDLTLSATETPDGLSGVLEYNADLFTDATADRLAERLRMLLEGVAADPGRRLSRLPLLPDGERAEVRAWGAIRRAAPDPACLHELFERQARRAPDAMAVVGPDRSLSYGELDGWANHLAHRLRALGVGPETPVGLCLDRSPELVVGILGILKAGGAYVPLDPAHPPARLALVLEDTRAAVVVTEPALADRLPDGPARVLVDAGARAGPPASGVRPANAAYVIHTSGSTGVPKGVVVEHRAVGRLFEATDPWFGFGREDVWTLCHSPAFDFSVWELWGALLHGGRLVVVPAQTARSPDDLGRLLREHGVTVLNQTPTAFRELLREEARERRGAGLRLRLVIFGGEALDPAGLREWAGWHPAGGPALVNMYGITETTVHVTFHPVTAAEVAEGGPSLIGIPIPDLAAHVLDRDLEPVPVGVAGELYVAGAGLARGYAGRPELTAERFLPDPHGDGVGRRMYRTGDVVRWRVSGELEFLGRADEQVKVRGFRVEPGEVEAVLSGAPGVRAAAVAAREERLVAYLVGDVDAGELRRWCRRVLPEHLVPAVFVAVEGLPVTAGGKVDRRALAEIPPTPTLAREEEGRADPASPEEAELARIWGEVLGVEGVGVDDDFFDLGGDSIRSIRVRGMALERGLRFTVQELFQHPTVAALAELVARRREPEERRPRPVPLDLLSAADRAAMPAEIEDAYPMTKLQAGMLFHSELSGRAALFHDVESFHLRGPFDAGKLRAALDLVVSRHPVLRTSLDPAGWAEPLQLVHRAARVPLAVEDLRHLTAADQDDLLGGWLEGERQATFDWSRPPLVRFTAHRRSDDRFQLTMAFHHAILDGWSMFTLLGELSGSYLALLAGDAPRLDPAPVVTMRDYVGLEREALASEESRRFWRLRLEGSVATDLASWPAACAEEPGTIRKVPVAVPPEVSIGLQELARRLRVPLKSLLLAAHLRVLSALSGQADLVTGLVSHGRPEERDGDRAAGLFLNTLPLRVRLRGGTWAALAEQAFAAERDLLPHRWYPMAELRRLEGRPLFETVFNFTHYHVAEGLREGFEYLGGFFEQRTDCRFLAEFSLDPLSAELTAHLSYHADVLGEDRVTCAAGCYAAALAELVRDPDARFEACRLLSPDEERRLLVEWPRGPVARVPEDTVHALFAAQARRTPDAVAVSFCGERLTYTELARRARRLARRLRACGVGPETLVGLCAERTPELVVGLLAVLEAGAAYVPVDPGHPPDRLASILRDLDVRLLVTQERLLPRLAGAGIRALCVDVEPPDGVEPDGDLAPVARAANLACVISTSGSSGAPKGVGIEHRSIVNLLGWAAGRFDAEELSGVLAASSICFDCAFFELLVPLTRGGRAILVPSLLDLPAIAEREEVTLIGAVPGPLAELLEADGIPPSVRTVNLAGDVAPGGLVRRLYERTSVRRVLNLYGPSEDTTYTTWAALPPDPPSPVPIGRPIANTRVYVLDGGLEPVPEGVLGELYVAGAGLARGYMGRPEQTAERFLPEPFWGVGERMYRTGDVVRWREGELEFVGRVDEQVKVRGYRVELGEVEGVLRGCEGVREAVVVKGERGLVGYVVLEGVDVEGVRGQCRRVLPEYMVPGVLVELGELPLTASGKVDRGALAGTPPPVLAGPLPRKGGGAMSPEEELVAGIWCEVLGVEGVGVDDDFFELGGDSLAALRAASAIARRLGWPVTVKTLLEHPTVAGIVEAAGRPVRERRAPERAAGAGARPHLVVEHRPLVGLLTAGRIAPVDAAALCTPSDLLPVLLDTTPEAVIEELFEGLPSLDGVLRTGLGTIAIITVPRFNRDLYEDPEGLLATLAEALELARHMGARVATLTDLLASATDYGRALPPMPVAVSTGHATTAATIVLTIESLLARAGRDFAAETVGFLGLGSIGTTTLRLALRALPHPRRIVLSDLYSRSEALEHLRSEARAAGFGGEVSILGSRGAVPEAFYEATFVVGATNVPDVLDVDRLRPGTIVADDSGPHCFAAGTAIRRLGEDADILFSAAGRLRAPEPIDEVRHVPRSIARAIEGSPIERSDPYAIEGCVLSSLLSARFPHLPPVRGFPDGEAALRHLTALRELGFGAAPLQCIGYELPEDSVAAFRSRFGHDTRRQSR